MKCDACKREVKESVKVRGGDETIFVFCSTACRDLYLYVARNLEHYVPNPQSIN